MRALLVSALLLVVAAVPPSRFNKKIDDTKLEKVRGASLHSRRR